MNTKLHAVADAEGRALRFSMSAPRTRTFTFPAPPHSRNHQFIALCEALPSQSITPPFRSLGIRGAVHRAVACATSSAASSTRTAILWAGILQFHEKLPAAVTLLSIRSCHAGFLAQPMRPNAALATVRIWKAWCGCSVRNFRRPKSSTACAFYWLRSTSGSNSSQPLNRSWPMAEGWRLWLMLGGAGRGSPASRRRAGSAPLMLLPIHPCHYP